MEERDQAVKNSDYMKAYNIKQQIDQYNEQLATLKAEPPGRQEKKTQDDAETTIRCLDILIVLLQQPCVAAMTPFVQSYKDMYLMPLLSNTNTEIFWRAMKLLVLYCLMDEKVMKENYRRIFGAVSSPTRPQAYRFL